jgi:hypothetical protein
MVGRHGGVATISDWFFTINGENGNVGIGTTSPGCPLQIDGTDAQKIILSGATDPYIRFRTGSTNRTYIQWVENNVALTFVNQAGDNFDFLTHDAVGAISLRLKGNDNDVYGYVYAEEGSGAAHTVGFLDGDGTWATRHVKDTSWEWRINNGTYMFLNSSGNLGIGTTSPGGKLHVYGGTSAFTNMSDNTDSVQITRNASVHSHQDAKLFIYDNSNADWGQIVRLGGSSSYGLKVDQWVDYGFALYQQTIGQVFAARTSSIVINEDGGNYDFRVEGDTDANLLVCDASADSVGIGTASPSQKLEVAGNIRVVPSSGDALIRLTDSGVRNWDLRVSDGSDYFEIDGTTSISLAIKGDGNVGIGTISPSNKLHVVGGSTLAGTVNLVNNSLSNVGHITINDPGVGEGLAWNSTSGNWIIDVAPLGRTNADGNLNFYNSSSNNIALWRPQLWVYDSSNYATATANSDGSLTLTSTNSGDTIFSIDGSNGTLFSVVDDLSDSLMSVNDAAGLPVLEVFADSHVVAGRYGQNDFYIDTGGNIGLGDSTPSTKLHVAGKVTIDTIDTDASLTNFLVVDGNGEIHKRTSGADGTSGSSGSSGNNGNNGTSGSSGNNGNNGNNGTSGSSIMVTMVPAVLREVAVTMVTMVPAVLQEITAIMVTMVPVVLLDPAVFFR